MKEERVAQSWRTRGFSCGKWADPPGQVWKDYIHYVDELVMLVDGELEIALEGNVFRPVPGEEVFIPAGVSHTVRNTGPTTNHWYYGYRRD